MAETPFRVIALQSISQEFTQGLYHMFLPSVAVQEKEREKEWFWQSRIGCILPLYDMACQESLSADGESFGEKEKESEQIKVLEVLEVLEYESLMQKEQGRQDVTKEDVQELLRMENETVKATPVPPQEKTGLELEEFMDYETLVKTFYTIDQNTMAGSDQLNLESLCGKDMRIDRTVEGPQILIYHTHSMEAFADSVQGDESTGILGVGDRLAEILRDEYGYEVLHHKGRYDVKTRDDAYGRALPALEELLKENPSIQVVIDLHRDQVPENTKMALDVDGRPTARFMFFNGLSRTRQTGDIAYLKNENIADNLAFSFQMQLKAQEYYPGLTRKIYLKGYRYNMHLCPKTLLVELGAQNNTVEEAMNACGPLARVLDMVIGGT